MTLSSSSEISNGGLEDLVYELKGGYCFSFPMHFTLQHEVGIVAVNSFGTSEVSVQQGH